MIIAFAKGELKKIKDFLSIMTKAQHAYDNEIYVGYKNTETYCISLHNKTENPTFKLSSFTNMQNIFPSNLFQVAYKTENLKYAIKEKPISYEIKDDGNIYFLTNEGKSYFVGRQMEDEFDNRMFEDHVYSTNFWFNALYDAVKGERGWKRYEGGLSQEEIARMINYEVVTVRPPVDKDEEGYNLALIMTNKLIPNIKKLESCSIVWLACDDEIFYAHIYCRYVNMDFYFENIYMAAKC